MNLRFKIAVGFLLGSFSLLAQDNNFGIRAGVETNYTGFNTLLVGNFTKNNHSLELGLCYNLSDGFSNKPVIGQAISYHYTIAERNKINTTIGLEYRRQKPIKIVNIQLIMYSMSMQYEFTNRFYGISKVGYGVASERALSSQSFSQSNIITGFFHLGCGYTL